MRKVIERERKRRAIKKLERRITVIQAQIEERYKDMARLREAILILKGD